MSKRGEQSTCIDAVNSEQLPSGPPFGFTLH